VKLMEFDPAIYNAEVSSILALDGDGRRPMPLAGGQCSKDEARQRIQTAGAALFPQARAPEAAVAGLLVYFSCMDEAHELAQRDENPDNNFWHGIVHRREPDAGNASYWFRRVGAHPIFPRLRNEAASLGVDFGPHWDPFGFIDLCEKARRRPDSSEESAALAVQLAEWQLLFDYCARPAK
jgi:hypothetical protein